GDVIQGGGRGAGDSHRHADQPPGPRAQLTGDRSFRRGTGVNYDDETLMAFADGELDELLSAEIASAMERDPALARRVERHRALRAQVAGAYSTVLEQPVPERLLAAANGSAAPTLTGAPQRRAEVLQFPARTPAAEGPRWGTREWAALAASLVLGMLLSWQFIAPSRRAMVTASNG